MKYIIDKIDTHDGKYTADWDLDKRLDVLIHKYKFKEIKLRDRFGFVYTLNTIRITSMKQLEEFMIDMESDVTITKDPGNYYFDECSRIIIS